MRLRTANCRRKRQTQAKVPKGEPFCYIVYGRRVASPITVSGLVVNYEVQWQEWKRPFSNYGEAIAHLTRVKLAIDEEDRDWKHVTPCKIVEGVYTKFRKEKITKVTRLNDECDCSPERHFSSRLPRHIGRALNPQPVRVSVPIPKTVGNPYQTRAAGGGYYTNPYVEADYMRSRGTTASSSGTTTVDYKWTVH